jgi:hypothetical protein
MRSKIAQRIMEDTPKYIKAKVKKYGKQKMKEDKLWNIVVNKLSCIHEGYKRW